MTMLVDTNPFQQNRACKKKFLDRIQKYKSQYYFDSEGVFFDSTC